MPKYLVQAETIVMYETYIEAETEEKAWEIAKALDGSEYACVGEFCWDVYHVEETDDEEEAVNVETQ